MPTAPLLPGADASSSLSDLGRIYCKSGREAHFFAKIRQIEQTILLIFAKNCARPPTFS